MKKFTIAELETGWTGYKAARGLRVLAKGEHKIFPLGTPFPEGATSAQVVFIKEHKSFPEYLKEKYNG
jgi:hypothetical protein